MTMRSQLNHTFDFDGRQEYKRPKSFSNVSEKTRNEVVVRYQHVVQIARLDALVGDGEKVRVRYDRFLLKIGPKFDGCRATSPMKCH